MNYLFFLKTYLFCSAILNMTSGRCWPTEKEFDMANNDAVNSTNIVEQYPLNLNVSKSRPYKDKEAYVQGVTVQSFSSLGQMWRILSRTTGRVHHLMSSLEYKIFIMLDLNPNIVDIETQFQHNIDNSLALAVQLGINHPPQNSTEKYSLTTDFIVTYQHEYETKLGIYAKYADDLDFYRTIEKLQLERCSLALLNLPLRIVTDAEIDTFLTRSLEWLMQAKLKNLNTEITSEYVLQFYEGLQQELNQTLVSYLTQLDKERCAEPGFHLFRFKCLVQLGYLQFDVYKDVYCLSRGDIFLVEEVVAL
jgi:hypothetical protein